MHTMSHEAVSERSGYRLESHHIDIVWRPSALTSAHCAVILSLKASRNWSGVMPDKPFSNLIVKNQTITIRRLWGASVLTQTTLRPQSSTSTRLGLSVFDIYIMSRTLILAAGVVRVITSTSYHPCLSCSQVCHSHSDGTCVCAVIPGVHLG